MGEVGTKNERRHVDICARSWVLLACVQLSWEGALLHHLPQPSSLCSGHSLAPTHRPCPSGWGVSVWRLAEVVCPSFWSGALGLGTSAATLGSLDDAGERVDGHQKGLGLGFGPIPLRPL